MLFHPRHQSHKPNTFLYRLLSLQKCSQQGSTLVVAVVMGVIVIGAAGLTIVKANSDKTNVTSDNMKKEVVAVGEGAVARFQNLFAQYPDLAVLNQNPTSQQWTAVTKANTQDELNAILDEGLPPEITTTTNNTNTNTTTTGGYTCPGSPSEIGEPPATATTETTTTTTSIGSSLTLENLKNKVKPLLENNGVVDVSSSSDGKSKWMPFSNGKEYRLISYTYYQDTNSGTLKIQSKSNNGAKAQLSVDIPVEATKGKGTLIPPSTTSSTVNVLGTGTDVAALWITDNTTNNFGNNNFKGTIKISSPNCIFTGKMPVPGRTASENNGLITVVKSKESMPPTPDLPSTYYTNVTSVVGQTLPRTTDTPDANGYYHYLIPSISLSGNNNFTVKANSKVAIYLQGDFSMSGNSTITVPSTSQLEIYGNTFVAGTGSKYKTGCTSADNPGCQTKNVTINGGGTTAKLFIHAPDATGGVDGGGNSNPNFSGSLWLKGWNGSNTNSGVLLGSNGKYGDYLGGKNRTVPQEVPPSTTPTVTLVSPLNVKVSSGISKFSMEQVSD